MWRKPNASAAPRHSTAGSGFSADIRSPARTRIQQVQGRVGSRRRQANTAVAIYSAFDWQNSHRGSCAIGRCLRMQLREKANRRQPARKPAFRVALPSRRVRFYLPSSARTTTTFPRISTTRYTGLSMVMFTTRSFQAGRGVAFRQLGYEKFPIQDQVGLASPRGFKPYPQHDDRLLVPAA
jgi:hypothetical protein